MAVIKNAFIIPERRTDAADQRDSVDIIPHPVDTHDRIRLQSRQFRQIFKGHIAQIPDTSLADIFLGEIGMQTEQPRIFSLRKIPVQHLYIIIPGQDLQADLDPCMLLKNLSGSLQILQTVRLPAGQCQWLPGYRLIIIQPLISLRGILRVSSSGTAASGQDSRSQTSA